MRPAESAKGQTGLTEGLGTAFPKKGVPNVRLRVPGRDDSGGTSFAWRSAASEGWWSISGSNR